MAGSRRPRRVQLLQTGIWSAVVSAEAIARIGAVRSCLLRFAKRRSQVALTRSSKVWLQFEGICPDEASVSYGWMAGCQGEIVRQFFDVTGTALVLTSR